MNVRCFFKLLDFTTNRPYAFAFSPTLCIATSRRRAHRTSEKIKCQLRLSAKICPYDQAVSLQSRFATALLGFTVDQDHPTQMRFRIELHLNELSKLLLAQLKLDRRELPTK